MRPDASFRRGVRAWSVACAIALTVVGCGTGNPPVFMSTDITGSNIGGNFTLADPTGKPRSLDEFRGKVVVLFFGYTQCPDVCPTTLADAAAAMQELGPQAAEVQVLFVTVDPERDTPELLALYVPAFHPTFLGLRGSDEELARAAKAFKVIYAKSSTPGGSYTMDHTSSKFVLDKQGRIRLLVRHEAGPAVLAHDIRQLLR